MNLPRGGLPDITFADFDPSQIVTRAIRGSAAPFYSVAVLSDCSAAQGY